MIPGSNRAFPPHKHAPKNSDDGAALQQRQVQWDFRDFTGRESNDQITSIPAYAAQRRLGEFAPYRVINNVSAFVTRQLFDAFAQVFGLVVDHFVGPKLFAGVELFMSRSASDDARPQEFAQFDRGTAHAAGGAEDQERFP